MGRIRAAHAGARGQLLAGDDLQHGHLGGEPPAQQPRALQPSLEQLVTVAHELPARSVDAREQERGGARGLLELAAEPEALGVDAIRAHGEDRGLAQAGKRLVR